MNKPKKAKKTKGELVVQMLKQGMTIKEIRARMPVTYSYVYNLRKKLNQQTDVLELTPAMEETVQSNTVSDPANINSILNARGSRYGPFITHASVTQAYKTLLFCQLEERGKRLAADQQEALDMIFHKIGRIINGDPDYADSWIDIAGYAQLVADRLGGKVR